MKLKWLTWLSAAIAVATAVRKLVIAVESEGHGEEKKKAVLGLVEAIYDAGQKWIPLTKEEVLKIADRAIEVWVAFYNLLDAWPKPAEDGII